MIMMTIVSIVMSMMMTMLFLAADADDLLMMQNISIKMNVSVLMQ